MKKSYKILFVLFILFTSIFMFSCKTKKSELEKKQEEIYFLSKESGYQGTYEDWLESIKGEDGKDGVGIVDIYINESGNIIVELSNGQIKDLGNLGGAGGGEEIEGVVPVYQGMSIESNLSESRNKRSKNYDETINEFLDIETTEKVEYYASKGEKFNIVVHLYNPSSYEILSFTLNGYKYQSFEFKEGSNSNQLIIEVDAGQKSGLKEYTIDAIKYIDGVEIKDVQMDGEKTIKAAVRYEIIPSASIINEEIKTTSFTVSIEIKDELQLINTSNGLHIFIFDGTNIISNKELKLGVNIVSIEGLLMGQTYDYVVVGVFDDYSGSGKRAVSLVSDSFETLDGYQIEAIESTQDSVKISLANIDVNSSFEKIELYHNNSLVESKEYASELVFEGLLSDNEYELILTYKFNKDGIDRVNTIKQSVFTKAKAVPSFTLNELSSTKSSVSFKVEESDIDNVKISFNAYLYNGINKVSEVNELSSEFLSLLSDTNYKIVFEYKYDLNDGNGTLVTKQEYEIKTVAKEAPVIDISYSIESESLTYSTTINDKEDLIESVVYKLYHGAALISQSTEGNFTFEGLSSNTLYNLEVTYKYDLNDGKGLVTDVKEYEILLSKEVPSIELTTYLITQTEAEYNILIKDPNAVGRVNMIALYIGNTFLMRLDETTTSIEGLSSNTDYNIRLNYVYDLDDGNGSQEINYTYEFKTLKAEPVYNLEVSSIGKDAIDFRYNLQDPDNALTFEKLELFHKGNIIETYEVLTETMFNNLLSDNEYQAVVTFKKDLNNGETTVSTSVNTRTAALTKPNVNIQLDSERTSLSYTYEINDSDNVGTVKSIDLYYQGVKLEKEAVENVYEGLYTNSEYELVITLINDYKNGQEPIEETYSKKIQTKAYIEPSIGLTFTSTAESINYNVTYNDPFNLVKLNKINVYLNEVLVKEITEFEESTINGLLSNTLYKIEAEYEYDLNDNSGVHTLSVNDMYSTLAYDVIVTGYEVLNKTAPKTNEDINLKINLENESNVLLEYVIVNGEKQNISGGDKFNNIIIIVKGPKESGEFNINVSRMGYRLNGVEVEQDVETLEEINIEVLSRLDIISVSTLDMSNVMSKDSNIGIMIEIDNPNNYIIESYSLTSYRDPSEYEAYMIDSNHVYIPDYSPNNAYVQIKGVVYSDSEGNVSERKYTDEYRLNITILDGDSSKIKLISTAEEFINMQNGYAYQLTNDIDLSEYNWVKKAFHGYFDGRGYSIKNLTILEENEYDNTNISIFNGLNGIFKNVYFENIYINAQSNYIYSNLITEESPNTENVQNIIFSGDVNFTASNGYNFNVPSSESYYIVDSLNINGQAYEYPNIISKETFESESFRKETLGWDFTSSNYGNYNGLIYTICDDSYIFINSYEGEETELIIPEYIEDLPVIGISDYAFSGNESITSLIINDNILYVGSYCAMNCTALEVAHIPSTVISIGTNIFNGCTNISDLTMPFIGSIDLEYLFDYGNASFSVVSSLKTLTINKATSIGDYAFTNCRSLTSIVIPEGVTSIGYGAFGDCSSLTSIDLPDTLTSIGDSAFAGCGFTSIDLPDTLTSIGDNAFFYCSNLTSIVIPEGVTSIGDDAFRDCSSLTSIDLPDTLTSIGDYAFIGCSSLTSIDLPDTLTSIGEHAFYCCYSLTSVVIPEGVTSMGSMVFDYCHNISIYCKVESKPESWNNDWIPDTYVVIWGYTE